MNKIIRLSKANIKKNIKETVLLGILIMLGAVLLASATASFFGIKKIMPQMVKETECYRNYIYIAQDVYSNQFLSFPANDARIEDFSHAGFVYGDCRIKDKSGSGNDKFFDISFISESGEKELEKYGIKTKLSDEELAKIEHPIFLGKSEKDTIDASEGEEITFVFDNKEFSYTVAGFYEPGLWMFGAKAVISDEDFGVLEEHLNRYRYEVIGFDVAGEADTDEFFKEYREFINEESVEDVNDAVSTYSYEEIVSTNETNTALLSVVIVIMSGVIILAVIVMIRFRIITDINEQIVSIGVLEAIGYKAREIALSYILEYMLVALTGCVVAFVPSIFMERFLLKNAASSVHYNGQVDLSYSVLVFVMIAILLFVGLVAMTKALSVNKYPPVSAFRKGIATHHFKKSYLPLEKTKADVHIRLALKDSLQNTAKRAGFAVCLTVTTIMVVVSFSLGSFFGDADKMMKSVCGHELADISLEAVGGTDPERFADELRNMPEVDRVLLSTSSISVKVNDYEYPQALDLYRDFSETQTIVVTQGRLPKHANEIAITTQGHMMNVKMGETVSVEYDKVKRDFIICGVVNSLVNPSTVYMTEDGFKMLYPLYTPDKYQIFLHESADRDTFVRTLTARYGDDISEIKNGEITGDTYEERIRSAAEIKMAKAMSEAGVSYMEYSIRVGDEVISGSTSNMKINSLTYEYDHYKEMLEQLQQVFAIIATVLMIISAAVVMIILSILMSSTIRKQYKELGIMKGLGYTSRELKFQMAFRIIPPTVISVVIGTAVSLLLLSLMEVVIAKITVSVLSVVFVDIVFLLFCFLCAYVNTRKIGKISVYELMTE